MYCTFINRQPKHVHINHSYTPMKQVFILFACVVLTQHLFAAAAVKLYRYNNSSTHDHIFTTDWNELGESKYGYSFEGVAGYVMNEPAEGTVPCYRYLNSAKKIHFYTTSLDEMGEGKYGFQKEGIAFYVYATQVANTTAFHRYVNKTSGNHFYTTSLDELGEGKYGFSYEGIACYIFTTEQTTTAGTSTAAVNTITVPGLASAAPEQTKADATTAGSFFIKGVETKGVIRMYKQDYENEGIPAEAMIDAFVAEDGKPYNLNFKLIDSIHIGDLSFGRSRYRERGFTSASEEQLEFVRMLYRGTKASVYIAYVYDKSEKQYTHSLLIDKLNEKKPVDVQAGLWNIAFKKQLSKLFADCESVSNAALEKTYASRMEAIISTVKDYDENCK